MKENHAYAFQVHLLHRAKKEKDRKYLQYIVTVLADRERKG
jgi:hypothetical protein